MILTLKDIGAIREAEINIDGLTVLIGKNSTGKENPRDTQLNIMNRRSGKYDSLKRFRHYGYSDIEVKSSYDFKKYIENL